MNKDILIALLILLIVGILAIIFGYKTFTSWKLRVDNWKVAPDTEEYMDSLFSGWSGIMILFGGFAISIVSIICLIALVSNCA